MFCNREAIIQLPTWAWICVTLLNFSMLSTTCTSIFFNYQFHPSVCSCSSSTALWTFAVDPFVPLAMNGWKKWLYLYLYLYSHKISKIWYFILKCQPINNLPGQLWVLQGSSMAYSPSHLPPFSASDFFVLVFVLVPPPHGCEHIPSSQSFHSQSIAVANFWLVFEWLAKRISFYA